MMVVVWCTEPSLNERTYANLEQESPCQRTSLPLAVYGRCVSRVDYTTWRGKGQE